MISVTITKLTQLPGRPNGEFIGIEAHGEIAKGYEVKGITQAMPKVGARFEIERHERNGVKAFGQFSTSPVRAIDLQDDKVWLFTTANSVYRVDLT